jgi:hypothetical protein
MVPVGTDVSEGHVAYMFRVKTTSELRKTLEVIDK